MTEIFKTMLLLSALGGIMVCLMLIIKLFLHKYIAGKVQLTAWILVALSFILPVWKLMPAPTYPVIEEPVIILPRYFDSVSTADEPVTEAESAEQANIVNTNSVQESHTVKEKTDLKSVLIAVWIMGVCGFMLITAISYISFLAKKHRNSILVTENEVFQSVKKDLNIKRNIRMRKSADNESPFLTGVFFPVIYVPESFDSEDEEKFVYYHELVHYKNKDLLIKWFVLFINALHWFNPFCYILTKNVGDTCEICCDISVTKNMNNDEKKKYMNTILNLVSKKG